MTGLLAIPALLALGSLGLSHACKLAAIAALRRRCRRDRLLVLTYDDGPEPAMTFPLLALLREHAAVASFFPLGRRAQNHPRLLDAIAFSGHEIGTHSHNHLNAWRAWPAAVGRDIDAGYRTLAPWCGGDALFRPPHGKATPRTWLNLRRRGAQAAWWTIDSCDTRERRPAINALLERSVRGGVILLHDMHTLPSRVGYTLDVTAALLGMARREGLRVVKLSTALNTPAAQADAVQRCAGRGQCVCWRSPPGAGTGSSCSACGRPLKISA